MIHIIKFIRNKLFIKSIKNKLRKLNSSPSPNPIILRLWLDALKSGKYTVGRKFLCSINEEQQPCYCPLGVLLEVLIQLGFPIEKDEHPTLKPHPNKIYEDPAAPNDVPVYYYHFNEDFNCVLLPTGLGNKVGLDKFTQFDIAIAHDDTTISYKNMSFNLAIKFIENKLAKLE